MPDAQREVVLGQVIDILLELSTLRFDRIGSLFKTVDGGWRIEPSREESDIPEATYRSGIDQFLTTANAQLHKIPHRRFGNIANKIDYINYWFVRSLIPCFHDSSLDAQEFPLMHGDFIVVDVENCPRITAIIDHPLHVRNVRDQASFNRLLEKAEWINCQGLYLFEQCVCYEYMYHSLFWELVQYIFGPNANKDIWYDYTDALERGLLKGVVEKLAAEANVADEAREVLDNKVDLDGLGREEFIMVAKKYKGYFSAEGKVVSWLNQEIGGLDH